MSRASRQTAVGRANQPLWRVRGDAGVDARSDRRGVTERVTPSALGLRGVRNVRWDRREALFTAQTSVKAPAHALQLHTLCPTVAGARGAVLFICC